MHIFNIVYADNTVLYNEGISVCIIMMTQINIDMFKYLKACARSTKTFFFFFYISSDTEKLGLSVTYMREYDYRIIATFRLVNHYKSEYRKMVRATRNCTSKPREDRSTS